MAKKKKPAANPARGFATTSVASKIKPEKDTPAPEESRPPKEAGAANALLGSQPSKEADGKNIVPSAPIPQTAEELEAQLEHDDLQLLVEKHAAKTRRESRRQITKIQTDQRLLRGQSQGLGIHDWVPTDILESIIALAQIEANDANRKTSQQSLLKVVSEEEAIARLWTLDLIFRDLGFSSVHIQNVLKWVCAHAASLDPSSSVWGLQEGLEWLALDHSDGHELQYDESKAKPLLTTSTDTSIPSKPSCPSALPYSTLEPLWLPVFPRCSQSTCHS